MQTVGMILVQYVTIHANGSIENALLAYESKTYQPILCAKIRNSS